MPDNERKSISRSMGFELHPFLAAIVDEAIVKAIEDAVLAGEELVSTRINPVTGNRETIPLLTPEELETYRHQIAARRILEGQPRSTTPESGTVLEGDNFTLKIEKVDGD